MRSLLSRIVPEREILVELEEIPPDLPAALAELPFVRGVSMQGVTLVVTVAREGDPRKPLSERLIRQGLVPLRIEERTASLEEAFITITQENVARLARGGAT